MSSRITYREHKRSYNDDWGMIDPRPIIRGNCIELLTGPGIASFILVDTDDTLVVIMDAAYDTTPSHCNLAWDMSLWMIQDGQFVERVSDGIVWSARATARDIILCNDTIDIWLRYEDERYYTLEALI